MPAKTPVHPKVKAAAAGGTSAGTAAIVVVWLLEELGVDVPPEVAAALGGYLAAVIAFIAGYQKASA